MGCTMPNSLIESALGGAAQKSGTEQPTSPNAKSKDDLELESIADQLGVCIKLFGCGGAGCNTITRCVEGGLSGVQMTALNTDAKHLLTVKSQRKLLIGKVTTRGLGAGARPEVGEKAAMEKQRE